jgi:hypothetical protein
MWLLLIKTNSGMCDYTMYQIFGHLSPGFFLKLRNNIFPKSSLSPAGITLAIAEERTADYELVANTIPVQSSK